MAHWDGISDCPRWWDLLQRQSGDIAFDIGANGGHVSNMFAAKFDKVIVVEPAIESFEDLVENCAPNVTPVQGACAGWDGAITLEVRDNSIRTGQLTAPGVSHVGWGDVEGGRTVRAVMLDSLVDEYGLPDVVKIDVEGSELAVLQGAGVTLAQKKTAWLIEVHSSELGLQLMPYIAGYDIEKWIHSAYREESRWRTEHYYLWVKP